MLHATILVCALGAMSCDRASAVDVLVTPVMSGNPGTCFMQGQAYLAQSALGRDLPQGVVVKIDCRPQIKTDGDR